MNIDSKKLKNWEHKLYNAQVDVVDFILKYLNKGDVYIDVGSNTGIMFQLLLERLDDDEFFKKAILFEPVEEYYIEGVNKFQENSRIITENIALSDNNLDKEFYIDNSNLGYNKIFKKGMDIFSHTKRVIECITFSNYAKINNISRVDFVKIDAEGHDCEVISGMIEWLHTTEKLPYILFEGNWYTDMENDLVKKMNKLFGYELIIPYENRPDRFLNPIN